MSTAPRPNTHHIAIGFCILGLGVVLILDRIGVVPAQTALRYWPLALVVVGLSVIVQACRPDAPVVRSSVPWGSIFMILILGFSLSYVFERRADATSATGPTPTLFAVLTGARHTADSGFEGARVTTLLGGAHLDLRNARPAPGEEVVVDVFTLMGGSVLLVPPEWRLDVRAASFMGGIADQRQRPERPNRRPGRGARDEARDDGWRDGAPPPAGAGEDPGATGTMAVEAPNTGILSDPPRLVVRGFVGLGGLAIKAR
jgi:hypothetical protein